MSTYEYNIISQGEPNEDGYCRVDFEAIVDNDIESKHTLGIKEDRIDEDILTWIEFFYG